jgi:hypothetical protein
MHQHNFKIPRFFNVAIFEENMYLKNNTNEICVQSLEQQSDLAYVIDTGGRVGATLRQLACCVWGSNPAGARCLTLVNVICCQVEDSAMARSLIQRGPTECHVPVCDIETSTTRRPRPQ